MEFSQVLFVTLHDYENLWSFLDKFTVALRDQRYIQPTDRATDITEHPENGFSVQNVWDLAVFMKSSFDREIRKKLSDMVFFWFHV